MKKILIASNYELTRSQQKWFSSCPNGCHDRAQFVFNAFGTFDLVCEINWSYKPLVVTAPRNQFVKLVQEPDWPGHLTHRFVDHHRSIFRTIRGHDNIVRKKVLDSNFQFGYSFLPHHVSGSAIPEKTRDFSAIASRRGALPGHAARTSFVDEITDFWTEIGGSIFGRGRNPIATKEKGLDDFRYSLVIENSSIPNYVTEKFTDAILRGAVPIYFGAPNIGDIFPEGSFIRLQELSHDALQTALFGLGGPDYASRIKSLIEAQRLLENDLRICCWLNAEESQTEPMERVTATLGREFSTNASKFRLNIGKALGRG